MASKDDALTDHEFDLLLAQCNLDDPRERVIILLAGELDRHEGEMAALQSGWINFQRGHIVIPSRS